jgi:ribose transport system substrate-binding protein
LKKFHYGLILFIVIILVILSSLSCAKLQSSKIAQIESSSTDNGSNENVLQKKKVALIMKNMTNPFFAQIEKGARQAEEELGIDLIVKASSFESSDDEQIAYVEDFIAAKVDAIVITPCGTDLIPVLKKAQDAGIVIVTVDNKLDPKLLEKWGLSNVPYISVDNEQGAYLSAKFISDKITSRTEAVIIEGLRTVSTAQDRKNGALRAFSENRNITVVASETANWNIKEAYTVIAKLYKTNPNIKAIFCSNDMMALGAIHYLQENKIKGVLVAAYDGLDEARLAIRDGWLTVTVDQNPREQGYLGVKTAFAILNGAQQSIKK